MPLGTGLGGTAAFTTWAWPKKWPPLVETDKAAKTSEHLFNRGLVSIDKSGWVRPEGVQDDYPVLKADISADIVVIGAGLAGTSLALHLAKKGIDVAVLEARTPGWGASGRNAGHVLPILKDLNVVKQFPNEGRQFLDTFREHHTIPFDLARDYEIDCDAEKTGYLNVMTSADALDKFKMKMSVYETGGLQKLVPVEGASLYEITGTKAWSHGLIYPNGGRINPYLLSNGLAKAAINMSARVFAKSEAQSLIPAGKKWQIKTPQGSVIADRVVFCTNAYPTEIVPQFANSFYPLTAYALTTQPLSAEASASIMPGGQTLAQVPIDLNPLVKDCHNRLILSSIPQISKAENAEWHFNNQLNWLHKIWPVTRELDIKLETYWTGRVGMRDKEFPAVYEVQPGIYGLMHFNAWGNVMAPLMGKLLAEGLAVDKMDALPFPIEKSQPVKNPGKQERNIRQWMIPAARQAQRMGII